MLTQSIDWAVAENSRQGSKYYGKLDTTKVTVAGFSCGGLEAYAVSNDPRVTTTGIFSSGLLNDADDYQLRRLTKPIAYFIGGPSDIAYPNAMDDWGKLPAGLPAFMGNLNVGHGGTYDQTNGGEFGRVAVLYLKWRLKGDATAGGNFVGADCGLCRSQWPSSRRTSRSATPRRPDHSPDPPRSAAHHAAAHHAAPWRDPRLHRGLCRSGPVERRIRRQRHRHRGDHRAHRLAGHAQPAERRVGQLGVERRCQRDQRHHHRREPELQRATGRGPGHQFRIPGHRKRQRNHHHLHRKLRAGAVSSIMELWWATKSPQNAKPGTTTP